MDPMAQNQMNPYANAQIGSPMGGMAQMPVKPGNDLLFFILQLMQQPMDPMQMMMDPSIIEHLTTPKDASAVYGSEL